MTRSQMLTEAHKVARIEAKRFGISYRVAFANSLRGFWMVAKGYRGVELK